MSTDVVRTPSVPSPTWVGQATAVEQSRAVAEVQAAIVVAQQCPRDMVRAWAEMRAACGRLGLASRAFYSVTNRGSGPSVHLARELARIWGNLDYGVRELRRDDEAGQSEIQAYAWDQQTNVRPTRSLIVPHARMKDKKRVPLTDLTDVYLNNQNIGARAVRECLFSVMPADYVAEAQELCRATIEKGDGQPLDRRIADMVAAFGQLGVKVGQIETRLGHKRGQWTAADVADLGVVFSSIKRREATVDEEFPERVTAAEIQAQAAPAPTPAEPIGIQPSPEQEALRRLGRNLPEPSEPVEKEEEPPARPAETLDEEGWPDTAQPPDAKPRRGGRNG